MKRKKTNKTKEVVNSEPLTNDGSEEWQRFEQGLRRIFSLTPEEARKIRGMPAPKDPEEEKTNSS